MNRLVNGDIVHQTALMLEVFPIHVFTLAQVYANKPIDNDEATRQQERWRNTGKYNQDVENLCLDLLSKRVGVNSILGRRVGPKITKFLKGKQ